MYLSRLQLNPSQAAARRDLADAYQMHRTLARVYAADADTAVPRFLWRLEPSRGPTFGTTVLVQAASTGHWHRVVEQADYLDPAATATDKVVDLERLVQAGRVCRFRLRANPAVKREGKRWGLHDESAQLAWLVRQGARCGFRLQGADVSQRTRVYAPRGKGGPPIVVDSVLFDGLLVATDAALLRQALLAGIGPAKSLGMGMLSLAPASA